MISRLQDLLLLSDVLGQAVPAGATATELAETLAVARVECERRRVTKNGKVKSKLSVVGVRCVDCAVSDAVSSFSEGGRC